MLETAQSLYVEGKQRGQVFGYALACIELARTFRAPATAAKMWAASGYSINQAIAAGLSAADVAALRRLAPVDPADPVPPWARSPQELMATRSVAVPQ